MPVRNGFYTFGWGRRLCPGLSLIKTAVRALCAELPNWDFHLPQPIDLSDERFEYLAYVPTNRDGASLVGSCARAV